MKHIKSIILALICLSPSLHAQKAVPGTPVWAVAAQGLRTICTVESKVCALESIVQDDFIGTYTALQTVLDKVCSNQSIAEDVSSSLDMAQSDLPTILSKLCVIDSKVDNLDVQIESLQDNVSGIFTALDGLQTTVCSKLELVNSGLEHVAINITNLTQSEIEHTQTTLSKLEVIESNVETLNSVLDVPVMNSAVNQVDSCVDQLVSLVDDLRVDVCDLGVDISVGFAGTFTALDAQLAKSCSLVDLVDAMAPTVIVDFSGVFTALDALQTKVCDIDSLVDIVCFINSNNKMTSVNSKTDIALSKICQALQVVTPLPSVADAVMSKLATVDISQFDALCSNIEVAIGTVHTIESKVDTIESRVDALDVILLESKVQQLCKDLITVDSKLDRIDVMDSKLCVVDSKIDYEQQEVLTIDSLVDVIDSQVDLLASNVDTIALSDIDVIESKLCKIAPETIAICSKMDELIFTLSTVESKLDELIVTTSAGDLCLDFGSNGTVTTALTLGARQDIATAALLQPDGKIVAVGDATSRFGLARYHGNGMLDSSFGTAGIVVTDLAGSPDIAHAALLQPDGKIIAVGRSGSDFALVRYNSDGSIDTTFGTSGVVITSISGSTDIALAALLQPDGKIIALGRTGPDLSVNFVLVRYNSDGSIDSSFGTSGVVITDIGGDLDVAHAALLQPDGKIVAIGRSDLEFALARYNNDGSLDSSFGVGGIVTTVLSFDDVALAAALQPDGKIIATGFAGDDFGLARYNSDGSLDSSFGVGGIVITEIRSGDNSANAVLLQPDDKIVAVGRADPDFALARYASDGTLDPTFGSAGTIITDFEGGDDSAGAALLLTDGRIIAVGEAEDFFGQNFALACYESGLLPIWFVKHGVNFLCARLEAGIDLSSSIESKLCLIEDTVCTVESNLDVSNSIIDNLSSKAMDLEADFAFTWTILDTIENKLCTSESILEVADSKLDATEFVLDFSGVFTVIDTILDKECTVDSKMDIMISLADVFIENQGDLTGVYTVLDALLEKVCTIDSQTDIVDNTVDNLVAFCGIPIRNGDLPLTISTPGRYFFAEDLDYADTATAIIINSSDVTIDLNNYTLSAASASTVRAIQTNWNLDNLIITNGTIRDFDDGGIFIGIDNSNVLIRDCVGINVNEAIVRMFDGVHDVVIDSVVCSNGINSGVRSDPGQTISNVVIKNSVMTGNTAGVVIQDASSNQVFVSRCKVFNSGSNGMQFNNAQLCVITDCVSSGNGVNGIRGTNGFSKSVIKDTICAKNTSSGLVLNITPNFENIIINNVMQNNLSGIFITGSGNVNNYVAFNAHIENGDAAPNANYREFAGTGANTYLGNFAFNSTADVGTAPDNTNYRISGGSDITGKFTTVEENGAFPATIPTKWMNINMLP